MEWFVVFGASIVICVAFYIKAVKDEKRDSKFPLIARRKKLDKEVATVAVRGIDIRELLNKEKFDQKSLEILMKTPIEKLVFKRMDAVEDSAN